jgi:hypothetical protein
MGVVSVRRDEYEPKAECPSCGRPVAMAQRKTCVYCGRPLGDLGLDDVKPDIPPEITARQDRAFELSAGVRWGMRWGAIGLAGLMLWLLARGSCTP